MTEQDQYKALQEYNYFEMLVNTKKVVTEDEYKFIVAYDPTEKNNFTYVGSSEGDYLNLNVYSEHDHQKRQYEMELG